MGYEKYDQVRAVIDSLEEGSRSYLEQYFEHAPDWFLDELKVLKLPTGSIFIKEGDSVQLIYMLVEGSVKATDYRIHGAMYDYMWFKPVKAFGGLEVILGMNDYKTTLMATTPCTLLVAPRSVYEKWLFQDVQALRMESSTNAASLLKQTRRERVYLFMQGMDRMAYFLLHYYEQFAVGGICHLKLTRQDMSDCTGLSIKTVNRSLLNLIESGCIGKVGSKIVINKDHFQELKKYMSELVE